MKFRTISLTEHIKSYFKKYFKKALPYIIILILAVIICILLQDGCNSRRELKQYGDQLSQFKSKEQSFKTTINKQGIKLAQQQQIILTQKQAIEAGLIENTELKKIKSQVTVITKTEVEKIYIPFAADTHITIAADSSNIIRVPKPIIKLNEWYSILGSIQKTGIVIDSLSFFNHQTITIGEMKLKGIRNIFKPPIPTVEVKDINPYATVQKMSNITIKEKQKKFFQTTAFKLAVGFILGSATTSQIVKAANSKY